VKVDVAINYYGKPYQTLLTLESLLEHSNDHIDLIYLIKEAKQPRADEDVSLVTRRHADRMVVFTPAFHLGWRTASLRKVTKDADFRRSVRYQYALEATNKRYLFITHNDVLYTTDLVGKLLGEIQKGPHAGSGLIGQCWNCPASTADICDGNRHADLKLTYVEALSLSLRVRSPRTRPWLINPANPVPLPECRLNEFACVLDVDLYRRETMPWGSSPPFGYLDRVDIGCSWFRSMILKGHTFANVDINDYCVHVAGHPDLFDPGAYERKESIARKLLSERYGLLDQQTL
jgi:hypothetical protein